MLRTYHSCLLLVEDKCLYPSIQICTLVQYKEMKFITLPLCFEPMGIHYTYWVLPRSFILLHHQSALISAPWWFGKLLYGSCL